MSKELIMNIDEDGIIEISNLSLTDEDFNLEVQENLVDPIGKENVEPIEFE